MNAEFFEGEAALAETASSQTNNESNLSFAIENLIL